MGDLCISWWWTGEAKRARKVKSERELQQNTWKNTVLWFLVSFCRLLVAHAALLHSGHLPQTEQQNETLTAVGPFYWPLRSFFGSAVQLKDSLGWRCEEGAVAGKTTPKYPFTPVSEWRKASLDVPGCCESQCPMGKCPTGQWTEPTITLPHLECACLVISADLPLVLLFFE